MSLKFVIPPMTDDPKRKLRKYAYYSERTGLRTFTRRSDVKNSINYQLTSWEYSHVEEDKDKPYYNRRRHHVFSADIFILELVDGEWFTRHTAKKGDPADPFPGQIEKVEYTTKYGSTYYDDISTFDYHNNDVKPDGSGYTKSVKKVWRNPTEAESRESYVQWRIAVDREVRSNQKAVANPNRVFNEFVTDAAKGNTAATATAKIW